MGNTNNLVKLITCRIDKGNVNEKSLYSLFASDNDFSENEVQYRGDTLELGYENEAERVSKEIFERHKHQGDELSMIGGMLIDAFNVAGFIGASSYYGDYEYEVIETEFEYIVVVAVIM